MSPKSSNEPHHLTGHTHHVEDLDGWWNQNTSSQDPDVWNAPLEEDPPLSREELQMREHQYHVERVADLVPYWIKCVNAAAIGEELRLEPFLNTLKDVSQSWMTSDNPWAPTSSPNAWGPSADVGRWGVPPDMQSRHASNVHTGTRSRTATASDREIGRAEKRKGGRSRHSDHQKTAYAFVEDIARHEAANAERKRRMHMFFEMPTQEKVKKITEIVRYLQSASA